jgi:hypothetical protein
MAPSSRTTAKSVRFFAAASALAVLLAASAIPQAAVAADVGIAPALDRAGEDLADALKAGGRLTGAAVPFAGATAKQLNIAHKVLVKRLDTLRGLVGDVMTLSSSLTGAAANAGAAATNAALSAALGGVQAKAGLVEAAASALAGEAGKVTANAAHVGLTAMSPLLQLQPAVLMIDAVDAHLRALTAFLGGVAKESSGGALAALKPAVGVMRLLRGKLVAMRNLLTFSSPDLLGGLGLGGDAIKALGFLGGLGGGPGKGLPGAIGVVGDLAGKGLGGIGPADLAKVVGILPGGDSMLGFVKTLDNTAGMLAKVITRLT